MRRPAGERVEGAAGTATAAQVDRPCEYGEGRESALACDHRRAQTSESHDEGAVDGYRGGGVH